MRIARLASLGLAVAALAGCSALDRLATVGEAPKMTDIQNPQAASSYRPISMPMPAPMTAERQPASLWAAGSRGFFKDQRANRIGDILTVLIAIDDKAKYENTTTRSRSNADTANLTSLFGLQGLLNRNLTDSASPSAVVDLGSTLKNEGKGAIDRSEEINLKIAATVTQVLPNGNMVVSGRQEVKVNYEVRELQIAGVIRPEDVTSLNTISYEKMAEARISYGGRGHITDVQQPRYGAQVLDILLPF
ncbi:MAG: flagellar basal body L-ring protein FlgH [Alphaproteobacteria bacterium]|nr:flagellar basal body L-ring protein FlgH [Alphaproteobacteria bacterium]